MSKIKIFALLFMSAITWVHAQEDVSFKGDAEKLYENIFPLGLKVQMHRPYWDNSENGVITDIESSPWSPALGLEYNFLQKGNFNFRGGLYIRYMRRKSTQIIPNEIVGIGYDYNMVNIDAPYWTYHIPLEVEHITYLNSKFALALNVGLELQVYGVTPGLETYTQSYLYNEEGYKFKIENTEIENQNPITAGVNLGTGIYWQTKGTLMKFDVNYHLHGSSLIYSSKRLSEVEGADDVNYSQTWTGDYLSLGVTFFFFKKHKGDR